ncbi:MAG: hypothetical protein WA399_11460, partial [Acidobacteriaceae bacterium]
KQQHTGQEYPDGYEAAGGQTGVEPEERSHAVPNDITRQGMLVKRLIGKTDRGTQAGKPP